MPHGTPDWGHVGPLTTVFGLDDLGETVVRLGSPHLWDRRGAVVWLSDFREGMGIVEALGAGAGADVALVTGYTRQGAYAVKLTAGTTAPRSAYLQKMFPYPVHSRVGFEFSFSCHEHTDRWGVIISGQSPTHEFTASVEYDHVNSLLTCQTPGALTPTFATLVVAHEYAFCDNVIKMVIDLSLFDAAGVWAPEYVRVILNHVEYPVTILGVPQLVDVTPGVAVPFIRCAAYHYGLAAGNAVGYVDNAILTQNEP